MTLRRGTVEDLSYILGLERTFRELGFVGGDDITVHQRRLADPDCWYCIVETESRRAGYAILRGLTSVNGSVELKRIAISEPGRGLGRRLLEAILKKAFDEFSAHRIWLDVFTENSRARHVYRSVGFVEEGVLRECVKHGDTYRSLVLMSMLESEYQGRLRG
jgi:diamine N-acetyltransferase